MEKFRRRFRCCNSPNPFWSDIPLDMPPRSRTSTSPTPGSISDRVAWPSPRGVATGARGSRAGTRRAPDRTAEVSSVSRRSAPAATGFSRRPRGRRSCERDLDRQSFQRERGRRGHRKHRDQHGDPRGGLWARTHSCPGADSHREAARWRRSAARAAYVLLGTIYQRLDISMPRRPALREPSGSRNPTEARCSGTT